MSVGLLLLNSRDETISRWQRYLSRYLVHQPTGKPNLDNHLGAAVVRPPVSYTKNMRPSGSLGLILFRLQQHTTTGEEFSIRALSVQSSPAERRLKVGGDADAGRMHGLRLICSSATMDSRSVSGIVLSR